MHEHYVSCYSSWELSKPSEFDNKIRKYQLPKAEMDKT